MSSSGMKACAPCSRRWAARRTSRSWTRETRGRPAGSPGYGGDRAGRAGAGSSLPFDLAADLPIRARLVRLGDREHILYIVMHHIAADGWSIEPLLRDLAEAYGARARGRP